MEEKHEVEKKRKNLSPPRGGARAAGGRRPFAERLQAVKLHLEEGFSIDLVAQELQVSPSAVHLWLERYRQEGEEGLKDRYGAGRRAKLPAAVREQILSLKKEEPSFGIKKISQWLKRVLFLQASPETVRQTLQQEGLVESPPKARRNLTRPRFFERATPNQMWQSDIFTFRLGGRYAYLIAFMDDYSRFLVGADLFRSPTAQNVIEVFRVASGEYQPPKEMLTDQGRQYTTWRGTSRFEAEMKKNGIHHFKSRPHHPMTLGKVERFWETIWQEFLSRAQFESFESARDRIRLWVRYYNHKRPHQGIEGLCPADRFFEVASQLRQTIEAGIKENLLELALRGEPKAPFYMVGRMEGQSVILRAEKGKLKLSIDNGKQNQELVYDLKQTGQNPGPQLLGPGQGPGGAGHLDRTVQAGGSLPSVENQLGDLKPVADPGHGGNAPGPGTGDQSLPGSGVEPAPAGVALEAPAPGQCQQAGGAPGADPACQASGRECKNQLDDPRASASGPHPGGALRPLNGQGSGSSDGHLPQVVLPVGGTSIGSDGSSPGAPGSGTPPDHTGPGEGATPSPGAGTGGATADAPGTGAAAAKDPGVD